MEQDEVKRSEGEQRELVISDVHIGPIHEGYYPLTLVTNAGNIACRYYQAPNARRGVIWAGCAAGGWGSPAKGLYPRLCHELMGRGISSLWVCYRHPTELAESAVDVVAGIDYFHRDGVDVVALVGHSFGAAVVVQAAAVAPAVRTVVALATQCPGAELVSQLAPGCSILLIHGVDDHILPPYCSEHVYSLAHEPKRLILYPMAGHSLDEVAEEVRDVVRDWIVEQLNKAIS